MDLQSLREKRRGDGIILSLKTKIRPGKVTKLLRLKDGQNAVYVSHILEGYSGKMSVGHHATLAPQSEDGELLISTSPIRFGITHPLPTGKTQGREYFSLLPCSTFKSISKVPTLWKDEPFADLSVFPRRKGFVDIVQVYAKSRTKPGWSCAVFPKEGFLWFGLKDTAVLPSTVLWMENHGRHQSPWNGRNCCIGIEEVCAYSALGLKESAKPNAVNEKGIPTTANSIRRSPSSSTTSRAPRRSRKASMPSRTSSSARTKPSSCPVGKGRQSPGLPFIRVFRIAIDIC